MGSFYKKCPKCGADVENEALFCGECGYRFEAQKNNSQPNTVQRCPVCGGDIESDSSFCGECGYNFANQNKQEFVNTAKEVYHSAEKIIKNAAGTAQKTAAKISDDYQRRAQASREREYANAAVATEQVRVKGTNNFVDSDEYVVKTLGNGYLQNIVTTGNAASTTAVLTQKRLYFSGVCFEKSGITWKKVKTSKIIDLEDITGTGFTYKSHIVFLICAIVSVILSVVSFIYDESAGGAILLFITIAFVIVWMVKRITLFNVEYAGGKIGFDVKWLNANVVSDFQKQIHRMKARKKTD